MNRIFKSDIQLPVEAIIEERVPKMIAEHMDDFINRLVLQLQVRQIPPHQASVNAVTEAVVVAHQEHQAAISKPKPEETILVKKDKTEKFYECFVGSALAPEHDQRSIIEAEGITDAYIKAIREWMDAHAHDDLTPQQVRIKRTYTLNNL